MSVEVFLDDTPGEVRGVIARDGRFQHLLIQRDDGHGRNRLGARSTGRIIDVQPGLKGAFVELGDGLTPGFLPFKGPKPLTVGQKVEVEVTAEPRERKGPTLRLTGPGEGEPRLLSPGPSVAQMLAVLAPGAEPVTGLAAIRAGVEAEEEAMSPGQVFADIPLSTVTHRDANYRTSEEYRAMTDKVSRALQDAIHVGGGAVGH